ncbi:MAG: hypothetical protein AAFY38_08745 [Pseudomonadota bacterium]
MRIFMAILIVLQCALWVRLASAQVVSVMARGSLMEPRGSFVDTSARAAGQGASLFAGPGAGLFAPGPAPVLHGPRNARIGALRDLIAKAEAGKKGYDAVQHGARVKTPRPPTQMTVQQIYDWIDATPGQPHAIGRYQFIPRTLRSLMERTGTHPNTRFSPALQDKLADELLADAGLARFLAGKLPRQAFMNNLAKIWAGLPNDTGKSHYHGYAGNKATMTWARFEAAMMQIFPG